MDQELNTIAKKPHPLLRRFRNTAILCLVVIALTTGIVLAIVNPFSTESKSTRLGLENIGELATQAAYCTQIGKIDGSRKLFNTFDIPFTQSTYIYSYDVVIKAGFDFSDITYHQDQEAKTIRVTLPAVRTLSKEVNTESFQVYLENESIFRPITLTENNQELSKMIQQAETDAIANGLYDNALSNAKVIISSFLTATYSDQYKIIFIDSQQEEAS